MSEGKFALIAIAVVLANVLIWGAVLFVAYHFIAMYW